MLPLFRLAFCVALLLLLYLGLSAWPAFCDHTGVGFWDVLASFQEDREARARGAAIDAARAEFERVAGAKDAVIADAAAGRRSLLQAAARYRALILTQSHADTYLLQMRFGGATEDEAWCRAIIHAVQHHQVDPDRPSEAANRLSAELEALLRMGPVNLPAVPTAY